MTATPNNDKINPTNGKIIIKKSISKTGFLCSIYIIIALYLLFINGNGSDAYITRKGQAIGVIFLLSFTTIFIYNIITLKLKYITIDDNGFHDNISILFPEMYPWHKIINIEIKNYDIIITTKHETKRFGFLDINKDNKKRIQKFISLHLNNQHY